MNDERTFTIQPGRPDVLTKWYAGSVADGRLVLARQSNDALLEVIWFTPQGTLLGAEKVPIPKAKLRPDRPFYPDQVLQFILDWQKAVGFRSHPITVRHFHIDEPFHAGLRLLFLSEFRRLEDPYEESDPTLREELQQLKFDWLASENFVLYWGLEAFGMNREGFQTDLCDPSRTPAKRPELPDRLFTLRTYPSDEGEADFYTGRLADGRQALLGIYLPELVLVLFSGDGTYLEYQTRPLADGPKSGLITDEDRAEFTARRVAWQRELGWQEGPIQVRRFMLPYHRIYLTDYPAWAAILEYDPYFYSNAEEREEMRRQKQEWEKEGCFVFWWGRDYHLSKEGEVLST